MNDWRRCLAFLSDNPTGRIGSVTLPLNPPAFLRLERDHSNGWRSRKIGLRG